MDKQEQLATWGSVDEITIARFLAGECTSEERQIVKCEMASHPKLAECIRTLMNDPHNND